MTFEVALTAVAAPFVGSFLGTLALRLPVHEPVMVGRSMCPTCRHTLGPHELLPLLSWAVQRGRCRNCRAAIPTFYPAIECAAVAVVVWALAATQGSVFLFSCVLGWALLALAVMDWRTLRLADAITLPLALAGLGAAFVIGDQHVLDHVIGMAAGFSFLFAFGVGYRAVRGHDGLGLGDAKLLAAGGAWVGWEGLPSILVIGSMAGLLAVVLMHLVKRHVDAATRLPFGTFLALGIWLVWLYGPLTVAFGIPT